MSSPTLLMTRPEKQARAFVAALHDRLNRDIQVCYSPLIQIEPVSNAIDLRGVSHLLFTSANGVECFCGHSENRSIPALCVGDTTADTARAAGFAATSAGGSAVDLVRIAGQQDRPAKSRMLYLRGNEVSFDLKSSLQALNIPVSEVILYRQTVIPLSGTARLLLTGQPVVVPIFSAKAGRTFLHATDGISPQELTLVCMRQTIAALIAHGIPANVKTAHTPSRPGMIEALDGLL